MELLFIAILISCIGFMLADYIDNQRYRIMWVIILAIQLADFVMKGLWGYFNV